MQEEYNSLVANGTWELSTIPEGRRVLGTNGCFVPNTMHRATS